VGRNVGVVTVVFELDSLDVVIADTAVLVVPCDVGTLEVALAPGRVIVLEAEGFVEDVGTRLGWTLSALMMSAALIVP